MIHTPAKHLNFRGLVLDPLAEKHLNARRRREDFEDYAFDGELFDVIKRIFPPRIWREVEKSVLDERCTKQFYHREPMDDQFERFLVNENYCPLASAAVRAALIYLRKLLPKATLTPMAVEDAEYLLTNKKGVVGSIGTGTKGDNIELCKKYAYRIARFIKDGIPYELIAIPATMGHRAQLSRVTIWTPKGVKYNAAFDMKDRVVFVVDAGTVLFECKYARPLYELLKERFDMYVGGKSPDRLRWMIEQGKKRSNYWLGTDISRFDSSLCKQLINVVFELISEYFPVECRKELDWIRYNFIHTPMFVAGQGYFVTDHGVPSGSAFTQIVGTLANAIINLSSIVSTTGLRTVHEMVSWLEHEFGTTGHECSMFGMGDDFLLFPKTYRITEGVVKDISVFINKVFGMEVNPQKCDWGWRDSYPHFLKREWRGSGEWQEPISLLINVIHPEHRRYYQNYSPYHILYGLYLAYRATFDPYVSESELIDLMQQHGGIDRLREIELYNLPGVVRGLGENPTEMMARRVARLQRRAEKKSS